MLLLGLLQYETPKITTRTTKTATGFKTTSVATTKTSTTKTPDGLTTTKPSKPTPQPTKLKSPTTTHLSTDKTTPKTEVPTTPNIFTTMTRVQTNASGNIPTVAPIPVNPGQPPSQVTTFSELGENISPRVCGSFRVLAVCSLIALCVCSWLSLKAVIAMQCSAANLVHFFLFLPVRLNLRGGYQTGFGIQVQKGGLVE